MRLNASARDSAPLYQHGVRALSLAFFKGLYYFRLSRFLARILMEHIKIEFSFDSKLQFDVKIFLEFRVFFEIIEFY